jgi:HSP20 family protein
MTAKKGKPARQAAPQPAAPADTRERVPELPAPTIPSARANSGAPGGGQGRVDITGRMPDDIRIDPDITEGHPGYAESGGSAIEVPIAGKEGADMAQRNKGREGNGPATQTKEERSDRNEPARRDDSTQMATRRNEHPLRRLHDEIDSLWQQFFGGGFGLAEWGGLPRPWGLDVDERANEVAVRAEAPGFEPKDFDIQINGNMLTIRAEHREEKEDKEHGTWQRRFGEFQRSVPLSGPVDAEKVEAHYRNGVLELHLPRTGQAERKRIEVKG